MKTKIYSSFCILHSALILGAAFALFITTPRAPAQTVWSNALSFDGVDDYVDVPDLPDTWFGNNFTIEAWVFIRGSNYYSRVIDFGTGKESNNVILSVSQQSSGKPFLQIYSTSESHVIAPEPFPTNQWVHLAATFQSNTGILYSNGVPVGTNNAMTAPRSVLRITNYIGRSNADSDTYANAIFDELHIWSVACTELEIAAHMSHELSGNEPNLVACWKFDESGGTIAYDATPNHLDASLVNGPLFILTQPALSALPDCTLGQGKWTTPLSFTVADAEMLSEQLLVTAHSGNAALVPNTPEALLLGGSGAYRTLQITPTPSVLGSTLITVAVSDGRESATSTFNLTVVPGPRLSSFTNLTIGQAGSTGPIPFTVHDLDTPIEQLTITVGSDTPGLVPNTASALLLAGSGTNRSLTVVPDPNAFGSATITVIANDGLNSDTRTFILTVKPRPVISSIPDQTILQGSSTFTLLFTVHDPDTPLNQLVVTATSDNPILIPNTSSALVLTGAGSDRALRVSPNPAQAGSANITVAAGDGLGVGTTTFMVRVLGAPTFWPVPLPNQDLNQGESTDPIPFTVSDPDTGPDYLILNVISDNPVLVPNRAPHLVLGGSGVNRTITIFPDTNHSGSALITLSASDGTNIGRASLTVTVHPQFHSPLLSITSAQEVLPHTWRFRFRDTGTDATNNALEYIPDLSPTNAWATASGTVITPESNGVFRVDTVPLTNDTGFFRVKGFRLVIAGFDSSGANVDEGTGTVSPVVVFNEPFLGTLRYTVSGTAGTNDYGPLSGLLFVNGSTAVIPVSLVDNTSIGQLKYLTLTLQGEPGGIALGPTTQTTLRIEENDAEWQGRLLLQQGALTSQVSQVIYQTNGSTVTNLALLPVNANSALDFVLRIQQSGGVPQAALRGNRGGFFPTNETPVELSFTSDAFSAQGLELPLPVVATSPLLESPFLLTLRLEAANGQPNQTVRSNRVQGVASLAFHLPDKPHLDTTNLGTFLLLKPAVSPPTNQVQLVQP